jgi:hypothetical protein
VGAAVGECVVAAGDVIEPDAMAADLEDLHAAFVRRFT